MRQSGRRHWWRRALAVVSVLLVGGAGGTAWWFLRPPAPEFMPLDRVAMPAGVAKGVVFLFSGAQGWQPADGAVQARLRADGLVVVGVDTPQYLQRIADRADGCAYMVSDVEALAQRFQRDTGSQTYVAPVVAGHGLGGGLALDMVDQTPEVTVGGTVAVDPRSAVPFPVELCTPAGYLTLTRGEVYALGKGPQPDPVSVILTAAAGGDVRARAAAFAAGSPDVTVTRAAADPAALVAAIEQRVASATEARNALPVTVLGAQPRHDVMAVILSGDGGWRDIDSSIGTALQADGVPVLGVDSLRYFWRTRTPEGTAQDLAALITRYRAAWGVKNVMLVGYSFGADVLPATYLALPGPVRRSILTVGLLGFSPQADWQITVAGWLGSHGGDATPTLPAAGALPLWKVLCVHGKDEDDSACPQLGVDGAELLQTKGGHHFGGDYRSVEKALLAAYDTRRREAETRPTKPGPLAMAGPALEPVAQ